MKKIIPTLVILSVLALPLMGIAQEEPSRIERCALKHDMPKKIDGVTYKKGITICISKEIPGCEDKECKDKAPDKCWTKNAAIICTLDLIYIIGDWIFIVVLALAFIFFLLGAVGFLTAGGDPEKTNKARDRIIYGAIGVAVAFLAKGIIKVVEALII